MSTRILQAAAIVLSLGFMSSQNHAQEPSSLARLLDITKSQPRTFENEMLFEVVDGEVHRSAGFTSAAQAMDFDGDDDVDLHDYTALQICLSFSGPEVFIPPACDVFDSDGDGDIDAVDTKAFMSMFTGTLSGVLVEAGSLLPGKPSPDGYYSGQPDEPSNNALHGIAAQSGYSQDDLWYEWTITLRPAGDGNVTIQNRSFPSTAFSILPPASLGEYVFDLKVTNLVTLEFGSDSVTLILAECVSDSSCDDGLWCNGDELCSGGQCTASEPRCQAELEHCNEELDACFIANCPDTFELTLATDTITGTNCDDEFLAGLIFNAATGTNVPSLQTGDRIDGGDGNDVMSMQFNFGVSVTVVPTISNVETLEITDFGIQRTTLSGTNLTGANDIDFSNGTNTNIFTVNNLPAVANLGVSHQAVGATLGFQGAATPGANDSIDVSVDGMSAGTITLTTGTSNGFETMNINSNNTASVIADIAMNGTTLNKVNITGDANLTHTASLDSGVATVNCSTATGNISLTQTNTTVLTYTGGAGNDTIILGATYDAFDSLDGGPGTDVLGGTTAVLGGTVEVQTNVVNFESLRVSDAHTTAINVTHFGAIDEVILDAASNGGSITGATSGFMVSCGANAANASGGGALTVTISGSATTDTATFTLNDCSQTAGLITFTGAETLNLVSNIDLDGSAANGGVNTLAGAFTMTNTAAQEKLVVTGNEALTITGAITAEAIDASGFSEPFIMGADAASAGVTIIGGGGADTILGSSSADIIDGGAGNDTIDSNDGDDIINGGAGADTFQFANSDQSTTPSSTIFTTITDFAIDSDIFDYTSAALSIVSGTTNFGVATASISSEGICSFNAADDTLQERIVACEDGIVENGAAAAGQFGIFEHGGNSYVIINGSTGDGLDTSDLLFKLTGVTGLTDTILVSGNLQIK
jgi:RTX calcium-binding nonapeptide repeat (4 copies)